MTTSILQPGAPVVPRLPGTTYRRFREEADYDRLSELLQAASRADGIPWLPSPANVRAEKEHQDGFDLDRDLLLAERDGALVGMSAVGRVVRDGRPVYELSGAVRPDVRRHGLGRALLEWAVDRARRRAAIEDPDATVELGADAEETETGHRVLLAGARFQPVRQFFLMRRPTLDDVPDVPLPDGIDIRPVTADQRRLVLDAEFEAFQDHWGNRERTEDSYARTLTHPQLDTELWVVAWDGDQIAGVVENWIWAEENEGLGVKRGWLERISVRRAWRRRGLARAITAESLRRLRAAGMTEGMLGVDAENPNGALGLYDGLGFEVHSRATAYRRPLHP
jgi:mycothiol synthase